MQWLYRYDDDGKLVTVNADRTGGERKKFNVYAETREQCEIKLAKMIERVKAEIAEMKNLKT